ncbi:methylated-DNA--[protein]-cysteine S-methyltransferase [Anaerovorax odorimutans]|uniref:Methylated-DNA--protein-cysteine methyltransferase n=1 Tax=Anaerovorax odorimutans TaxID=109327 RepID=A0ABT1RRE3_9FIRM|nr:methylated-DNA--[protein]-cysteine S-methyltransferase [Anaerovorax odorimutans]MCQ4637750.1 methylated-DNA--[protein]-cysteine S-methyltransferase [Anaerovorax odorimutans]
MQYTTTYQSPFGGILLAADNIGLMGLWFEGEKFYAKSLDPEHKEADLPVFKQTKTWLDTYFSGEEPDFTPPLHMIGSPFRLAVWKILQQIPYGETTTYGEIARIIAKQKGLPQMSAQAVGGAVGHNEISIIVPCHRVVGTNGSLTGYAGGIDKKLRLLTLEGVNMSQFFVPKKGTAL